MGAELGIEDCLEIGPWLEVDERRLETGIGMRLGPASNDSHTELDNSFISVRDRRLLGRLDVGVGRCCVVGPALSALGGGGTVVFLRCLDSGGAGSLSHG